MKPKPQGKTKKMWAMLYRPNPRLLPNLWRIVLAANAHERALLKGKGDVVVPVIVPVFKDSPVRKGRKVTNP